MLGRPGTGKSAIANSLCERITGGKFFSWLLNRTSDPSEILGPFSLKAMEEDKFLRKTTGKLPECNIAFIDEIFKSNEPTLNMLLPLINEKKFFNDGVAVDVPLITLFAASNETPEDDESLDALYDRLIFRMWVDYVKDPANKIKMYSGFVNKRAGVNLDSCTTVGLDEIYAIQAKSQQVEVPKDIMHSFVGLINILSKSDITVSDRRQNECFKILQGNAVLNNRDYVTNDDFGSLVYVLWKDKEDVDEIKKEIHKIANPYDEKILDIGSKFSEVVGYIKSITDAQEKCAASVESKGSLDVLMKKLDPIIRDARKAGKDITEMKNLQDEIKAFSIKLIEEGLGLPSELSGLFDDQNSTNPGSLF